MAPVQTQTATAHHFPNPIAVLSSRVTKPPQTRSKRNTTANTSTSGTSTNKSLLSYSPQIPSPHPDIPISLLRNKLLLTCRQYIPSRLLTPAFTDGIYVRATHWITSSSLAASRGGKAKRYYVLHTEDFSLQQVSSAWEARVCSGGSKSIDAGNGVSLFVKERREWVAFMRGYKRGARGAGELMRGKERENERRWREGWRARWGLDSDGKEGGQGPMWVVVKSGVERIKRGEA
ncbi:hypothetical protein IQ06DRAFT_91784 [Phaeosphaeriaceae sp. SRC1lsM3a]|nr:hypothetical protein IQ06DRAFT_91784 [Stagonospora sp. SRC1lsM3a]